MPQNVNDFNHNDLLSNIDPDINDNRQSSCQYFDSTLFNNKFGSMNNMSIFHCNIRSSSHNLSHLKNYLATLNLEFSIIGISENWGTIQNIDIPTRVTQSSTTLLDNIYTIDPMSGQNGVLTSDFSDHFSIFTIRQNMEQKIPDNYRYKREFTNKNIFV